MAVRARGLVAGSERAVLAIVGAPGAGKSTLVDALLRELRAGSPIAAGRQDWLAHLPMDGFHLSDVELDRLGRRDRKGAIDTFDSAGYAATVRRLVERTDEIVYAPGFERDLEQPIAAAIAIPRAAQLILTEGLYLLHDDGDWAKAARCFSESWFVAIDDGIRRERLVARHVAYGKSVGAAEDWVELVDEPNARLVAGCRSRATLLLDLTGWST